MQNIFKIIIDEECLCYKGYSYDIKDVFETIMCISREGVSFYSDRQDCNLLEDSIVEKLDDCPISFDEISKKEYDSIFSEEDCLDYYIVISTKESVCNIGGSFIKVDENEFYDEGDDLPGNFYEDSWYGTFEEFKVLYDSVIEDDCDHWFSEDEDYFVYLVN